MLSPISFGNHHPTAQDVTERPTRKPIVLFLSFRQIAKFWSVYYQVFHFITPSHQQGFLRNRFTLPNRYGVAGKLLDWFADYPNNRRHKVVIGDALSPMDLSNIQSNTR